VSRSADEGQTWIRFGSELLDTKILEIITEAGTGRCWCRPESLGPYVKEAGQDTWVRRHKGLFSQEVTPFCVDPQDAARVYAVVPSLGLLFRTRDAGESWDITQNPGSVYEALLVHIRQGNQLLGAGGYPGISHSTDYGETWGTPPQPAALFLSLSSSPFRPDRVIACAMMPSGGGVLFRSEDFRNSWKPLTTGFDWLYGTTAVIAPSDPDRIYAGLGPWFNQATILLRSDDGGEHWRAVQTELSPYFQQLIVDPQDENTLYWHSGGKIRKSADGGLTYEILPTHLRNVPSGACFSANDIEVSSYDQMVLYADGLARSSDGGYTWDLHSGDLDEIQALLPVRCNAINVLGGPHPLITIATSGLFRTTDDFVPVVLAGGVRCTSSSLEATLEFGAVVADRDGLSDLADVWVRFSEYGIELPLFDDGLHWDERACDGYYAQQVPLPTGVEINNLPFTITAMDLFGQYAGTWPFFQVTSLSRDGGE